MQCRNHPEREAAAICQKQGVGFCAACCACLRVEECCDCPAAEVYCQHRTQCLVWEAARERRRKPPGS
jgi:hypothetical protein